MIIFFSTDPAPPVSATFLSESKTSVMEMLDVGFWMFDVGYQTSNIQHPTSLTVEIPTND